MLVPGQGYAQPDEQQWTLPEQQPLPRHHLRPLVVPCLLTHRPLVIPESSSICIHLPTCARSHARASFDGKRPMRVRRGTSIFFTTSLCPLPVISLGRMDTDWWVIGRHQTIGQSLLGCSNTPPAQVAGKHPPCRCTPRPACYRTSVAVCVGTSAVTLRPCPHAPCRYNSITSKLKWNQAIRQLPSRPTPVGARQQEICSALHDRAVSSSASAAAATASSASSSNGAGASAGSAAGEGAVPAALSELCSLVDAEPVLGPAMGSSGSGSGGEEAGAGAGAGSRAGGDGSGGSGSDGWGSVDGGGVLAGTGRVGVLASLNGYEGTTVSMGDAATGNGNGKGASDGGGFGGVAAAPSTPPPPAASTPRDPGEISTTTRTDTDATFSPPTPATASSYASLASPGPPSPSSSIDAPTASHHDPNAALSKPPPQPFHPPSATPLSDLTVRVNVLGSYCPYHPYLEGSITDSMMDSLDDPEAFAAAVSAEDATARAAAAAAAVVAATGGVVRGRSAVEDAVEVMSSGDGPLGQLAAAAAAEEEEEAEAAREAGLHAPGTPPPRP